MRRNTTAEVFLDAGARALCSTDASNYRVSPALVVAPRTADDVTGILAACCDAGAPVTMRGGGTSVAGNAIGPGVLVDTARHLNAILDVDVAARSAVVQPGVILGVLNGALAPHRLRVGPDPSSADRCTIGGMIGNNACGARSLRWGTTARAVLHLDVACHDGRRLSIGATPQPGGDDPVLRRLASFTDRREELIRAELQPWPRRVSGYALDHLLPEHGPNLAAALVGSEGTCAVVLEATLALVPEPGARALLVLGFPDDVAAAEAVPPLLEADPLTAEGISETLFSAAERRRLGDALPGGSAWLLVEADGIGHAEVSDHVRRLAAIGGRLGTTRVIEDRAAQASIWQVRQEAAGRATRLGRGAEAWPGLEDAAVPPDRLAGYLAEFHSLMSDHGLRGATFGHFGEGCVHVRIGFDLATSPGVSRFRAFMEEAADLVAAHGGSISGEHGDGRARSALLDRMFSPEMLEAFSEFKSIWDPHGRLNPGILVNPLPIDADLAPAAPTVLELDPVLAFGNDGGDFRRAVERCVGVGACVSRTANLLMCPSYQATGREPDSTRGRARLLQEMVAGDLAAEGWRSDAVHSALDGCLACKGCRTECPTGVDMAAYKAEFLAHRYRRRLRPRSHYSLGRLPSWLHLAAAAPRLAGWMMRRTPRLVGAAGGFATDRLLPFPARRTFTKTFRPTPVEQAERRVVLWPDTFNDHLSPEVLEAAEHVLAAAGFAVRLPPGRVCCGLTMITTGQLGAARRTLMRTLRALDESDDPVLVLEPSCAAALRTDLPELLPDHPGARLLAGRIATFAEILEGVAFDLPPTSPEPPIVQPHCHQQAILGIEADRELLRRAGFQEPEFVTGCCGLAGGFGLEPGHRDISDAVAGLHLLPALEGASSSSPVLADGFSCRTQIGWLTGRRALHLAEVLAARIDAAPRP
jgi:FAD/FMN-containing dehydrogenase/Fe-S oxidoreductase